MNHIVSKASKILNFLKRNLYKCPTSTKATAYISLSKVGTNNYQIIIKLNSNHYSQLLDSVT